MDIVHLGYLENPGNLGNPGYPGNPGNPEYPGNPGNPGNAGNPGYPGNPGRFAGMTELELGWLRKLPFIAEIDHWIKMHLHSIAFMWPPPQHQATQRATGE